MVSSLVDDEMFRVDEVMEILDEASQVLAYSRELERKSAELEKASADLRQANERLQSLDRLKDEFVSSVSHELRTPLTSIRTFSEILLDNLDLSAEEREKYLRIIVEESERLTRLINQVLEASKLASGGVEWHIAPVDLRGVLADSAAACQHLFDRRGATLSVRVPDVVPEIPADRDRLVQVVLNLLSNAAKFCAPDHGQVQLQVAVRSREIQVDVSDDGDGIAHDDQERIFERFQQVTRPGDGRPQGTGLGLPISLEIVRHLGGRLWVDSVPGHGATFSFTLPRGHVADHEEELVP
jgi:signal transduction histidine kinase